MLQPLILLVEMYHNMQMMIGMHMLPGGVSHIGSVPQITPVAPHLPFSAEMQKMIMDGRKTLHLGVHSPFQKSLIQIRLLLLNSSLPGTK